jgi:hypothetical protein
MATTARQPHGRTTTSSGELELEPREWTEYFHSIAAHNDGVMATVEVIAEHQDINHDLPPRPLRDIGYDRSDDVFEVAVGGIAARHPTLRCFVSAPRTIVVAESDQKRAILIEDVSGIHTLIRLFDPRRPHASGQGDRPRSTPGAAGSGFTAARLPHEPCAAGDRWPHARSRPTRACAGRRRASPR